MLPLCKELGLAYLPYFPLESGLFTGKYRRGDEPADGTRLQRWGAGWASRVLSEENLDKAQALTAYANKHDHSNLELAFAWLLANPLISW